MLAEAWLSSISCRRCRLGGCGGSSPRVWTGLLALAIALGCSPARADRILFEKESLFGRVIVSERANGLRVLSFGGDHVQSAYHPERPDHLVYDYVQVMAGAPAFVKKARRVLLIGLGGGTLPSFWLRHFPKVRVDAVDIDPVVVDAARRFFDLPRSPRLKTHVADGRRFIEESKARYDLVVLDAYGQGAVPEHLTTVEFLTAARNRAAPGGAVIGNLHANAPNYAAMLATYREVFPVLDVVTPVNLPASRVLIGYQSKRRPPRKAVLARLDRWTRAFGLPFPLAKIIREGWAQAPPPDPKVKALRDPR